MTHEKNKKIAADPFNGSNLKEHPVPEEFPEGSFGSPPAEPYNRPIDKKLANKGKQTKGKA